MFSQIQKQQKMYLTMFESDLLTFYISICDSYYVCFSACLFPFITVYVSVLF